MSQIVPQGQDVRLSALRSSFTAERVFENHLPDCSKHAYQVTLYPDEDDKILKWQSREKTERLPFVIYIDFESCLVPSRGDAGVVDEHIPSGFCAYTVSADPEFRTEPIVYSGRDCMERFYDHLAEEQQRIQSILERNCDMLPLTAEENERFDRTNACPRCQKPFSEDNPKVRHHNHRTGRFIDALCNACNLQITDSRPQIPVVAHSLRLRCTSHHSKPRETYGI
jgi:hypothetical protein